MKATDMAKTPTDAATDALRDALAALKKPNRLLLAERELTGVRNARAQLAAEQQIRISQNYLQASAGRPSSELAAAVRAGEESLRQCDETIKTKREALAQAREAFIPAFREAVDEPVHDIVAEIAGHLAEVDKLIDALREASRFAERNGIEIHRPLSDAHAAREGMAIVRRALRVKG